VVVDNMRPGGISCGAFSDGSLNDFAFSKYGERFSSHPDSKIVFKGKKIPLLFNYGNETEKVIKFGEKDNFSGPRDLDSSNDILKGETLFAVREEMAQKLSDVVLRRTQLGTAGYPLESGLVKASFLMAKELSWSEARRISEIEDVGNYYPPFIFS
jgi:glycerol-3-phosphate dehydrogenase